jgi:AcrR family transcriptional regulator
MASTEIKGDRSSSTATAAKRRYRKRERARQEAETRLRITEAVMELHRTVGPANTTVTDVAEKAGVGRMTVYNHFPTDYELIEACSTHWSQINPLPDPERWALIGDPEERLDSALRELYAWYSQTEDMMGKVLRDAPIVPALGELMEERWFSLIAFMVDVLARGRGARGSRAKRVRAAIRLAVDFWSWRNLTAHGGLDNRQAAAVAADSVRAAAGEPAGNLG